MNLTAMSEQKGGERFRDDFSIFRRGEYCLNISEEKKGKSARKIPRIFVPTLRIGSYTTSYRITPKRLKITLVRRELRIGALGLCPNPWQRACPLQTQFKKDSKRESFGG